MSEPAIKLEFAARLQELCTEKEVPVRGRQRQLATLFGVVPNAARKWLVGEGLPNLDQVIAIAKWGQVNVEWLLSGRGPRRGNLVPMDAVVLDEMFRSMPTAERRESIAMLKYELTKASRYIAAEAAARYEAALDHYIGPPQ